MLAPAPAATTSASAATGDPTGGSGNSATRICVGLETLSSSEPTLAAIAYLSTVKTTSPPVVGQNPAEWSCANDFHGAASFGNADAGGGWVDTSQPVFVIMNECVFRVRQG